MLIVFLLTTLFFGTSGIKIGLAQQSNGEIAFVANLDKNWDIFIYTVPVFKNTTNKNAKQGPERSHQQSSQLLRITKTPYDEKEPAWSQDGKSLVYSTTDGKIHIIDLTSKDIKTVKGENPGSKLTHPSFSPDGNNIALELFKNRKIDDSDLAIYNLKKENFNTFISQITSQFYPVWAPDGHKIAYINLLCGQGCGHIIQELWLAEANGQYARQLLLTDSHCMQPSWSPDGQEIAFSSNMQGNFDIFIYDLNKDTLQQITTHKSLDNNPAWSPDGKEIAFISTRTGILSIWVKDLETKKLFKLSPFINREIPCKDITWH